MDDLIKICAKYLIIVPVLVELYVFWRLDKSDRRQMFKIVLVTALISIILAKIGSQIYSNPRPQFKDGAIPLFPHGNDNGFPSDHTLLASVLALGAYGFNKKTGYVLGVVTIVIGWARVAAHVHHAVDIVGSIIFAAIAYLIATKLLQYYQRPAKS